MSVIRRRAIAALVTGLAVAMAGCGSGTANKAVATTTTAAATSTTVSPDTSSSGVATIPTVRTTVPGHAATTTATTRPGGPTTVQLTEKDDGTIVSVAKGTTIVVVLSSTYWMFPNTPNPAVLQQQGGRTVAPGSCPPGVGCGTASVTYTAVGSGGAQISASRTTCGEALLCTGKAGSYSVQVQVTG
jgi:hypothetical protein